MPDDFTITSADVMLRRDLIAEGWTDRDITRHMAAGMLTRVRYGAYVWSHLLRGLDDVDHMRVRSRAVLRTVHESSVLSHQNSLAEHGVPLWGLDFDQTHLTRTDGRAGRRESGIVHHRGRLKDVEWESKNGVPVVVPERAAIEVVTENTAEVGLVAVCGVLHRRLATPIQLKEAANRAARWPNTLNTRLVLARADERLTSVAEARTWHFFHAHRIERPEPQVAILDSRGNLLGIVDFLWRELGVFLEVDGRAKYEQHRLPGESLDDYLMREKRREEQICAAMGWVCVRVQWSDLQRPVVLATRIRKVLDSRRRAA